MQQQGVITLFDISSWDPNTGKWTGWKLLNLPPHLLHLSSLLCKALKGCVPHCETSKDERGWGIYSYLVKKGYTMMQEEINFFP